MASSSEITQAISRVSAQKLRKKTVMAINGAPCRIIDISKSAPGKHGAAKLRVTARNLFTSKKVDTIVGAADLVEVPAMKQIEAVVLSIDGNHLSIMDTRTHDCFTLKMGHGQLTEQLVEEWARGCEVAGFELLVQVLQCLGQQAVSSFRAHQSTCASEN